MSDPQPKSTIRQLIESGPTDPLLSGKLSLLEELQAAHASGDQRTMLEIGKKLVANEKELKNAQKNRRARMSETVAAAKSITDIEERTKALVSAFAFCVKEACAADAEARDIPTYNFGIKRACEVSDELEALDRFTTLTQFLDSPDIEVRAFAAVWLRKIMPERVLPILKEIDKTMSFGTPAGTQVFTTIFWMEHNIAD